MSFLFDLTHLKLKSTAFVLITLSLFSVSKIQAKQIKQPNNETHYRAEIIRTSFGIPHITADNYGSLGFGEGYAAAEDHVCNIAHGIVVANANRTFYHGKGNKNQNLMSDIVIRALDIPQSSEKEFYAQPKEIQVWITGYADGYNKYVRETGKDNITSWCKGDDWVKEIRPVDLFSRFQVLAQTAPRLAGMIVSAKPPKSVHKKSITQVEISTDTLEAEFSGLNDKAMGSNGWAFGKDRTETGRGLLLSNPHFPWYGTARFWEKHLTIPGKMDAYGVGLIGSPGVQIGFNKNIGWTHTVSDSERVTFYSLKLVKGHPTQYYYDGKIREMIAKKVSIPLSGGGKEEHTVWFSHYGPMVNLPGVGWSKTMAVTMRDANFGNQDQLSQWKDMSLAKDMDAFKAAHKKWDAMPWVNTMATSADGRAVYMDDSNVGRLSKEAIKLWNQRKETDPLTQSIYNRMGLIILDGSDSRFEWTTHPDARVPGVVPYAEKPQLDNFDYIFNSNDSYWLTNVSTPLEGYSPLYGPERTARTLRTRMNAKMVSDFSKDGFAGVDGKFSLKELQQAILSNRSLTAELLKDDLVAACKSNNKVEITVKDKQKKTVDLKQACVVLAQYNGHLNLDSKGAVLFREWIYQYDYSEIFKKGALFSQAFDSSDPVNTPNTLGDQTKALNALGKVVLILNRANLPLDIKLGDAQFAYRANEKIPMHGGENIEGIANILGHKIYDTQAEQSSGQSIMGSKRLTDKGYLINYGTSFIMSLSFTDDGPKAEAFLTYSESGDPTSEHYSDQTKLFSQKQWRPILFSRDAIKKDTQSSEILTGESQ